MVVVGVAAAAAQFNNNNNTIAHLPPQLDKTALTYTTAMTFFTDTGMNQDQYGWMASIFCA